MGKFKTKEEYIIKFNILHNNKYDYSKMIYVSALTPIIIICPQHGEFIMTPSAHLVKKQKCPTCRVAKRGEQFLKNAYKMHGDKFNYKLVKYINNSTDVDIICAAHGVFKQNPNNHARGQGCPTCGYLQLKYSKLQQESEIIERFVKKHGNKYNYDNVIYNGIMEEVDIVCHEHGIFKQSPNNHIKGHGCSECAGNKKMTNGVFIQRSKDIFGDKYGYELVEYVNDATPVKLVCPIDGVFEISPNNH